MPALMAPQLRTATGLVNVPASREVGPPHAATSRISRVTIPARIMNAISITGPIRNPVPPEAILDPTPCPIRVGMASQDSQASQCPMRASHVHISLERHAL